MLNNLAQTLPAVEDNWVIWEELLPSLKKYCGYLFSRFGRPWGYGHSDAIHEVVAEAAILFVENNTESDTSRCANYARILVFRVLNQIWKAQNRTILLEDLGHSETSETRIPPVDIHEPLKHFFPRGADDQVRICQMLVAGESQRSIAKMHGVSHDSIQRRVVRIRRILEATCV